MALLGLREWLDEVERIGNLRHVSGVDPKLEMGILTEAVYRESTGRPTLLFEDSPGLAPGTRIVTNLFANFQNLCLASGLPADTSQREFDRTWDQRLTNLVPLPPKYLKDGPVFECAMTGDDVDLNTLPAPFWHAEDGGNYMGTGDLVITGDPDSDWVNVGTYRVMVHDRNSVGCHISPGHHGGLHRDRWFAANKPWPVVISLGHAPLLLIASCSKSPVGVSEYDVVGSYVGQPVEVVRGPVTGLPFPADAEMVLEGEALPGDVREEGPFGEFHGYYAGGRRSAPVVRIKAVYHRRNPVVIGLPPFRPPNDNTTINDFITPIEMKRQLEAAGVPDVVGIAGHGGITRFFIVVAIKQRYPGHARQAGLIASQCLAGGYMNRFTVVVDDDIDPYNINDVIWALSTRCDPETSIQILNRTWSGPLDPRVPPERRSSAAAYNSRAVIDACKPFEYFAQFPKEVVTPQDQHDAVLTKFASQIAGW